MCGIAGVLRYDGMEPNAEELRRMTGVIAHRGPDDFGFFAEGGVGMGFRRLSIIDLAEGHQPLCNEDEQVWITFNGEIYNYKALRHDLQERGHVFRTHSDTEVIVHLYEEYGEACVGKLRGMFGFAIWDKRKRRLFGARDHFGIKPFYYWEDASAGKFAYASEIKSLLQCGGAPREWDMQALYHYLTFQYVPEPLTMFRGIRKLPPGHTISVDLSDGLAGVERARARVERYWDPMFAPAARPFGDLMEEVRERLRDSVAHHMVSDVQRGCFLSSGIDSTAIAALMRSIEPIKTFSVGFAGPRDETIIARESAKALGTDHYEKVITPEDYFGTLETAAWHQDEPVADPSAIALYHVAGLAREHVTVVLSGEGADELFGGYRIYREPRSLAFVDWLPRGLLRGLSKAWPPGVPGRGYLQRAATPLERRFLGNARIFSEDAKAELLRGGAAAYESAWDVADRVYAKTRGLDPVSRMQYIDLNLWMPGDILMKADKMTMAHSLELRVPFLDKELFELVRTIPAACRIAKGTTKYIFRRAMEGIVQEPILNRPKLGFPVPLRDWMAGAQGTHVLARIEASGPPLGQHH